MTIPKQAEQAAEELRQRGYKVVDNSWSYDDIRKRIKYGNWIVQLRSERPRFLTDLQVIELAGEEE